MIDHKIYTAPGSREVNEDYACAESRIVKGEEVSLFILCDGLGGHGHGEVASKLVCDTAIELFRSSEDTDTLLQRIFEEGQSRLLRLQEQKHATDEMKTTAVILLITGSWIQWGHVGDSRLYYFRKNKLVSHTLDHSVPQMLVSAGELKEKNIRKHPDRNRLLRVMGVPWEKAAYQICEKIKRAGNERFLLCSDGFWEYITETKMWWSLMLSKDAASWLDKMKAVVNENGKGEDMDNNTAITVIV